MVILRIIVWLIGCIIGSFIGIFLGILVTEGKDDAIDFAKWVFSTIFRRGE